ncbi:MAG: hypothetical protein EHM33_26690, partial [Chloroflexi bacterium]
MKRWSHCTMFVVTIFMVLAMSAMWTVPVLADDEAPPPTETSEVVPPPEAESTPESPVVEPPTEEPVVVVEETSPTEVAPAATEEPVAGSEVTPAVEEVPTETPTIEETPVEEPSPQEETSSEVLAQVPSGTDVVVVDEAGETVSLATQEAADILVSGDPIWCPATVLVPVSNGGGCSTAFGSMQEVITYLTANPKNVAGVIWIAKDYDSSVNDPLATGLTLNGDLLGTTANFALTLQGGWNGLGTGTIDTNDRSEFNVPLSVINWNANVTLSDLLVTGVTSGTALTVEVDNPGSIVLRRVDVEANAGSGAYLDNTDGGAGTGNVTINRSRFSNNAGGHGLDVRTKGITTLNIVTANNNSGNGVQVDNSSATAKDVNLPLGDYEFNGNGINGLIIWSAGNITLMDITATTNGAGGAYLNNTYGSGAITLTGINIFSENAGTALVAWSHGAISASNVIANSNGRGAIFSNEEAASAMPVTLTGTSEFKFNGIHGLEVTSKGVITLNNITAMNNAFAGAYLDNSFSGASTPRGVILNGYGSFHSNGDIGIDVSTYGSILLTNVNANDNGLYGAFLNNAGGGTVEFPWATLPRGVTLSLTGDNVDTEFQNNAAGGLQIHSLGTITLSGVTATGSSSGFGALLKNDYPGAVGGITLGGWGAGFHNNASYGLSAYSAGTITLSSVWAFNNLSYGALLDNR